MRNVVLIGASTGAPRTHHVYLQAMPQGFAAAIVIIQHMPPGPFVEGLLRYLRDTVATPVRLATNGDLLRPGEVLIAEPAYNVRFNAGGTSVSVRRTEGENYFAPSMDVTFTSAAHVFGPCCYGAMLSGLHADHDGVAGCEAIRRAGGRVLVTDRASTPCYRMIEQVRLAGACDAEASLASVLPVIHSWIGS
ncbi:MAG: CheB methylesterase domain-containing protein [Phycisphaerae bacterium]